MKTLEVIYRFGELPNLNEEGTFTLEADDDAVELLLHSENKDLEWDDMVKRLRLRDHISNIAQGYAALHTGDVYVACELGANY